MFHIYPQYEKISLVDFPLLLSSTISLIILLMVRWLSDINNISLSHISSSSSSVLCSERELRGRVSGRRMIVSIVTSQSDLIIRYLADTTDNLISPCLTSPYRRSNPR